jgi:outer membrane protein OmpA-like peptidoglycan-associated protein/ABC-type nitrate/sulfonate/bicarbonate transport system substrate-binding protein
MNEGRAKSCLIAAVIWCIILTLLGVAYKFWVHPHLSKKLKEATSSASHYRNEVVLAADSFSGYCVLRSEAFKQELRDRGIRVNVSDDKADYTARLEALRVGKVQLAAFTIDSLIVAGAKAGDLPATIVFVIDETQGGDALVAYERALGSVQDLNDPAAKIVLTPNSPSEFLARVVLAYFSLPRLQENWMISADGAGEVYRQFRAANPAEKKAYVLWEPYVSRALQQRGARVLLDSKQLKGYIVDVLVAQREFLRDKPELVRGVVEAYARATYRYTSEPDGLAKLVMEDARQTGAESLDAAQAKRIVEGIQWKNTLENYAHFGVVSGVEQGGLPTMEDMIGNIMDVLLKTKAIASDPLGGKYTTLFYDRILFELRAARFHPSQGLNVISGVSTTSNVETVRQEQPLPALPPEEWNKLRPVGELRVAPISFARASANLSLDSERELQDLARRLKTFPRFYVSVIGHARAEGDPEANRALAASRAEATENYLVNQGVSAPRLRTESAPSAQAGGEAQAVSFAVGQRAY